MITIDEFAKVEIRIGTVLEATKVPEADRLIQLIFDFGDLPETDPEGLERLPELVEKYPGRDVRQVMSAIAPFIEDPPSLIAKQIAVCVNLEPRKFKGYVSQGMILASGEDAETLSFLVSEKKVKPGSKIH